MFNAEDFLRAERRSPKQFGECRETGAIAGRFDQRLELGRRHNQVTFPGRGLLEVLDWRLVDVALLIEQFGVKYLGGSQEFVFVQDSSHGQRVVPVRAKRTGNVLQVTFPSGDVAALGKVVQLVLRRRRQRQEHRYVPARARDDRAVPGLSRKVIGATQKMKIGDTPLAVTRP